MKQLEKLLRRIPFTLSMPVGLIFGALVTNTYFTQVSHHWLNRTGYLPNDLWY